MKFIVLIQGKENPPEIPRDLQLQMIKASQKMIQELKKNGVLECAYSYLQIGNGFAVVDVVSHEQLYDFMRDFPEAPLLDLEAKPLVESEHVYEKLISVLEKG